MSHEHAIEAIKTLANQLVTPELPNCNDEWDVGYVAGRESAGQELVKVLREQGFYQ